jgi:hypothetical protein
MLQEDTGKVAMKAFSDGKLTNRRVTRSDDKLTPEKSSEGIEFTAWNPEELHQTQVLIQDLDKEFTALREVLHSRTTHLAQVRHAVSELQTLLFPSRRPWWRRWLPW